MVDGMEFRIWMILNVISIILSGVIAYYAIKDSGRSGW